MGKSTAHSPGQPKGSLGSCLNGGMGKSHRGTDPGHLPIMRVSLMHNAKGKQPRTSVPAVLLCDATYVEIQSRQSSFKAIDIRRLDFWGSGVGEHRFSRMKTV